MNLQRFFMAVALVATVFVSGCGDDSGGSFSDQTQNDTEKWNSYVDIINSIDPVVKTYLDVYFKNFPDKEYIKPEGKFRFTYSTLISQSMMPERFEAAIKNAGQEPQSELDKMALAYVTTLRDLWAVIVPANHYYIDKAYVDDSFAKGSEWHKIVIQAYEAHDATIKPFFYAVHKREEANMVSSYKQMLKDGLVLRPAMLNMIIQARRVGDEISRQNIADSGVPVLDMTALRPVYDDMVAALNQLGKCIDDASLRNKEKITHGYEAMKSSAANFRRTVAGMIENAQNGKDMTSFDNPGAVTKALNQLIGSYNSAM